MFVLFLYTGNWVCFLARNDESANNEVAYISISLVNFLEMIVIGGDVFLYIYIYIHICIYIKIYELCSVLPFPYQQIN